MKSNRILKRQQRREQMKSEKDAHRGQKLIKVGVSDYKYVDVTKPIRKYKDRKLERPTKIRERKGK